MTRTIVPEQADKVFRLEKNSITGREKLLAVAHRILNTGERGMAAVDIATELRIGQTAVSRTAAVLQEAGLVDRLPNRVEMRPGRPIIPLVATTHLEPTLRNYNTHHLNFLSATLERDTDAVDGLARNMYAAASEASGSSYYELSAATEAHPETVAHVSLLAFATYVGLRDEMLRSYVGQ